MRKNSIFKFLGMVLPAMLISCTNTATTPQSSQSTSSLTTPASVDTGFTSSSTGGQEEPDDPNVIQPEDSEWSEDVTNAMVQYLGGQVLPFVNIGSNITIKYNKNLSSDNYRSSLVLTGERFIADNLKDAKAEYAAHDWTCMLVENSTILYANRETQNLEISVESDKNGLFVLTAYWTEPYDETALTEWKDVTIEGFKNRLGNFYNIPFVYLGTTDYDVSYQTSGSTAVTIQGGNWDDRIIEGFENSFGNSGWKITEDEEDITKRYATYEYTNGTVLKATLQLVNTKAKLFIALDEAFDASNNDHWTSDIISSYQSVTSESLPYVYLGTVYPTTVSGESTSRKLTIKGKLWDDSIFDNAKTTYEAAGWTQVTAESNDETDDTTEESDPTEITFTKTVGDYTFTVVVYKVASTTEGEYYPKLTASMAEVYDETKISDWTSDIKSAFKSKFNDDMDEVVPFMYLGTQNPTINTTYTNYNKTVTNKLVITGGAWNSKMSDSFFDALGDGWTSIGTRYYDSSSKRENNLSGTNNTKISHVQQLALKTIGDATYKVGLFTEYTGVDKTVYLEITKSEIDELTTPNTTTDWTDGTKAILNQYFADIESDSPVIPYFDTGKTADEITLITSSTNTGKLKLQPTLDYYSMNHTAMNIYNTLANAGWDVTLNCWYEYQYTTSYLPECTLYNLVATKDFGNDTPVELVIYFNRLYNSLSNINTSTKSHIAYVDEKYDESNVEEDGWGEKLNALITEKYNFTLPYFYLGTKHSTYNYVESTNKLTIYGNYWSDYDATTNNKVSQSPIVSLAREALTTELGFTINNSTTYTTATNSIFTSNSAKVRFSYTTTDKATVTIDVKKTDTVPVIEISTTDSNFYDGSITEWNDAVKTVLEANLEDGMSVPYIYLGTDNPTVEVDNTLSYMSIIKVYGGKWNKQVLDTAKEQLEEVGGWNIEERQGSTDTTYRISAYKQYSNNTALRLMVRGGGDGTFANGKSWLAANDEKCCLVIVVDKPAADGVLTPWSNVKAYKTGSSATAISDLMSNKFGTSNIPDFLYLKSGETVSEKHTYSESGTTVNKYFQFAIGTTSDGYLTYSPNYVYQAKAALEAAGFTITMSPFTLSTSTLVTSTTYKGKPFAYLSPSFFATKTNSNGEGIYINFWPNAYGKNSTNTVIDNTSGYKVTIAYTSSFDDITETEWGKSLGDENIKDLMTNNGLPIIPYLNMGVKSSEITAAYYASFSGLRLTSYNFVDDTRLEKIKQTMEAAGWSMEYRQYYGSSGISSTSYYVITSTSTYEPVKYLSGTYTDADGNKFVFDMTRAYKQYSPSSATSTSLVLAKTELNLAKYAF